MGRNRVSVLDALTGDYPHFKTGSDIIDHSAVLPYITLKENMLFFLPQPVKEFI